VDRDDALRLLHVVDFIYDWERDIYRSNVLRCLENPGWGLRGVTPSDSRIGSLADSAEVSLVPTVHTNRVEGGFIMSYPKQLLVHLIRGKKDPVKESKTKLDIYFTPNVDCATLEGIQKVPAIMAMANRCAAISIRCEDIDVKTSYPVLLHKSAYHR